ncbi:MAG TPA: hypothetical protein VHZ73_09615 [Vicinamibacterales bacterium]|nr:hypothetical protein [Vicinamibacterales bacterium]
MRKLLTGLALAALLGAAGACNNGSSTPVASTTPTTTNTYPFSGALAAPTGGVGPTASLPFTVGQSGGTVTILLTAAVETYPNGTLNTAVTMLMGIGTPSGSTCTLPAGSALTPLVAGPSAGLQGAINAGSYCVALSSADLGSTAGSVSYTVIVTAP